MRPARCDESIPVESPVPNPAPKPAEAAESDPRKKLDAKVIAQPRARRYRAMAFQLYLLIAALVFVVLAVVAHFVAYFPIDLRITLAVQAYHGPAFATLMSAISWIGFIPQVIVIDALVILVIFFAGLRWEAISLAFAAISSAVGTLIKLAVLRPRPSADIVHVMSQLHSASFPSGHVLSITAFGGFLVFLCFTLLKPSVGRSVVLGFLLLLIVLMGPSRIYLGQHWFSDVMGAYLFGTLWLALTIRFYRWGKVRYFVDQPVAKPTSPTGEKTS